MLTLTGFEIARKQGPRLGCGDVRGLHKLPQTWEEEMHSSSSSSSAAEPLDVSNFSHVFPNSFGCWSVFSEGRLLNCEGGGGWRFGWRL